MWRSRLGDGVAADGQQRSLAVHQQLVAVAQGRPEDDAGQDRAERETASHAAHLLRRQPATGRSDEGAARRDDWTESASDPRLVPEQTLQGQETIDTDETDATAAGKGQKSVSSL